MQVFSIRDGENKDPLVYIVPKEELDAALTYLLIHKLSDRTKLRFLRSNNNYYVETTYLATNRPYYKTHNKQNGVVINEWVNIVDQIPAVARRLSASEKLKKLEGVGMKIGYVSSLNYNFSGYLLVFVRDISYIRKKNHDGLLTFMNTCYQKRKPFSFCPTQKRQPSLWAKKIIQSYDCLVEIQKAHNHTYYIKDISLENLQHIN